MTTRSDRKVRLAIMGLGGFGSNIIRQHANDYDPDQFQDRHLFAANTDQSLLSMQFPEKAEGNIQKWRDAGFLHTLVLGETAVEGGRKIWGAGTKPEKGAEAARAQQEQISNYIRDHADVALLLVGEGKGTGQGAGPVVAEILAGLGIPALALAVTPFVHSGSAVRRRATEGLRQLRAHLPTIVLQNDKMINHPQLRDLPKKEAWYELNRICIMRPLIMLSSLLQVPGNVCNIDLADLQRVCEDGNAALWGFWEEGKTPKPMDPEAIATTLIDQQFQDAEIVKHSKTALMWFTGSFTASEESQIINALLTRMDSEGDGTEIIPGTYDPDEESVARSIGFFTATNWDNLEANLFSAPELQSFPLPGFREKKEMASIMTFETETPSPLPLPALPTVDQVEVENLASVQKAILKPTTPQPAIVRERIHLKVSVDGRERQILPNDRVDCERWQQLLKIEEPTDRDVRDFKALRKKFSALVVWDGNKAIDIPPQYALKMDESESSNGHKKSMDPRTWFRQDQITAKG